jgi:hypothetical protein
MAAAFPTTCTRRRRLGGRSHHDPAACRRQVRPELLQGLRRPARRRRVGGQRAVDWLKLRSGAAARNTTDELQPRRADGPLKWAIAATRRAPRSPSCRAPKPSPKPISTSDAGAPAARTGLPQFRRASPDRPRGVEPEVVDLHYEGGIEPSCAISTAPRSRCSNDPIFDHRREGRHHGRGRAVVERQLPRERAVLHQQHPAARWRHPPGRLPRRADPHQVNNYAEQSRHRQEGKGLAVRR